MILRSLFLALLLTATSPLALSARAATVTADNETAQPVATPLSTAQDRIVAKVNSDIITSGDVWERYHMIQRSSRLPDSASIRQDAFPQILSGLIAEKLQLQEAKRAGLTVADEDIDTAFADLAKSNNVAVDVFEKGLEKQGVNSAEIKRQLKAQIAWVGVVKRVVRPGVNVTDAEVAKLADEINSFKGKKEYKIAEIRLPADTPQHTKESIKLAQNLSLEMRKGAPFHEVAAKFSVAASAKQGGLRSSVLQGELPAKIDKLVAEMPKGALSMPIEDEGQVWVILKLDERVGEGAPSTQILRDKIGTRKLEKAADAYLHDLRDEALIEFPG